MCFPKYSFPRQGKRRVVSSKTPDRKFKRELFFHVNTLLLLLLHKNVLPMHTTYTTRKWKSIEKDEDDIRDRAFINRIHLLLLPQKVFSMPQFSPQDLLLKLSHKKESNVHLKWKECYKELHFRTDLSILSPRQLYSEKNPIYPHNNER